MLSEERARRCLTEEWGLPGARLTRLDGGMGSRTWLVDDAGRRWVLKAVAPALGGQLAGGLAVAKRLDRAGVPAGDLTGIAGAEENEKGLEDARRALAGYW
jgi:hypothetical protein